MQGGDPRCPGGVGRVPLRRLTCGRRLGLSLPVRLLLMALAALLVVLLVLVIWTLPEPEGKPVQEAARSTH